MSYYKKYIKAYQKTPMGKYIRHKANSKRRGIEFKLTFEEWMDIWEKSGKWEQRGKAADEYCMGRIFDQGCYEKGNVVIITNKKNSQMGLFHSID